MAAPRLELSQLHLCFLAGTLGQGGAERQLFQMLCALQAQGTRLTVLSLMQGEHWQGRIEALGIPVTWVGRFRARGLRLAEIIRQLKRLSPNVIQSQHFYTNLPAALAGRAAGIPAIGALRSDVYSDLEAQPWLGKFCLRLPTALAANSRAAFANAAQQGVAADRLHLVPNVVDTEVFAPTKRQAAHAGLKLLAVGRLSREKRFDRFLCLVAALRQAGLAVTGLLVGDGPLRDELQQQAAALGLAASDLELRGATEAMPDVYRESNLLISTSAFEGAPNVILEAMACGLPVVATSVGGVPEIIRQNKTGFLTAPDNEAEMFNAVQQLIAAPTLRAEIGAAARQQIIAHYSANNLVHHLSALYRAVLS